jgi:hypothetical protein
MVVCVGLLEVHHQPLKIFHSFFLESCPQLGQTSSCDNYDNSYFPRVAQPQKGGKQKIDCHKLRHAEKNVREIQIVALQVDGK